jgi:cobalt-zinc-cadmium resistance protein CzcA
MLRIQGLPANLISMGALDFGLMLGGPLILTEVVFVAVLAKSQTLGAGFKTFAKGGLIKRSTSPVASSVFSGLIILMLALAPIFSFQKVEGKMFSPLAFTLGYALLGSLILSLTYVPVMCKILFTKPIREWRNPISRFLPWLLACLYRGSARFRKTTLTVFALLLVACVVRFLFWGTEFIPSINEGAIYVRATLPNSVNLDESVKLTQEMKHLLRQFDEVEYILTQTGRPNDGTDATGAFNIEFHVELKPEKEWQRKISKDALLDEMQKTLEIYPGIDFGFSQPIQDNVEEYVAGVKSALVIKIFGSDLFQLEALADKTAETLKTVRGIEDVNVFRSVGLPELQILPQENLMAKYAVSMADAQAVIEMAIGGKAATTFYEGERMFDVVVRFAPEFRDSAEKIGDILIPTMDDKQVPLKEIAEIRFRTGPAFIYREGSSRYVGVGFSIRDRDLGSTIAEAQRKVNEAVQLQQGNKMVWAGEFESQQRAINRLMIIVPAALLLSLFVLYINFGTIRDSLIVASAMPYAFIGGFLSIMIAGTTFGISVGIGFVILFGIVSVDNIILTANMKRLLRQTRNVKTAIDEAVRQRLRPLLMTSLMGAMGLLPAALSTGIGSEVQRPLATVVVGGQILCMILSLTVLPQVFYYAYRKNRLNSRK